MMRLFGSVIKIKLADLGEGTKGATIKEFFVKEGSLIKEVIYLHSNYFKEIKNNALLIYIV